MQINEPSTSVHLSLLPDWAKRDQLPPNAAASRSFCHAFAILTDSPTVRFFIFKIVFLKLLLPGILLQPQEKQLTVTDPDAGFINGFWLFIS